MPNVRELEDLIIDAIYLDILRGKLDQKEGQLEVEYTMGRDLEPGKLESILFALQSWYFKYSNSYVFVLMFLRSSTTASVLATLDEKINQIAKEANLDKVRQLEYDNQLQANLKEILDRKEKQNMTSRRTALGDRDNVPMDIDEPPLELVKGKNRKCGSLSYLSLLIADQQS
jgi:COP9 signalosome complex subunit 7